MADGDLKATLTAFAQHITTAADPHEGVSIDVTRRGGFQNDAVTPRGLSVLLDEPVHFGGKGEAPDPAEYLLAAIGASLSVTLTAHAALRDIPIDHVHVALSAQIDGRAFFAPGAGTAGLIDAGLTLTVRSPAAPATVRALLRDVVRATPVLGSLKRRPRMTLVIEPGA